MSELCCVSYEANEAVVEISGHHSEECTGPDGPEPGQEMEVIAKSGLVILVPERPISAMRGFARGIRTTGFREKKDRF